MALKSDARGFMVGEPIEIGRMPNDISRIRDDVSAIRRAIAERGRSFSGSARTNFATPERGANGRFVSKSTPAIATPSGSRKLDPVQAAIAEGARNAVAERIRRVSSSSGLALPGRDSAGKFTSGGINSGSGNSAIASIGDRLARLTGAASGIEDVDPAVKAAREIAEPMQRTFEFFRGDKQTLWLKKIFSKLNVFHKEESVYNRATKETLEKIERKPVAAGAQSGLMSAISSLPVIGSIARAIGITTVGGGMLGTLAKGGRGMFGLLKRVPVLGSLLAAGGAAFDIFDSENSGLSRRDKDKAAGTSIGGWAGSLGGVAAGALAGSILGPVGTIVGGIVGGFLGDQAGQIIGDKFGGWVSDLREADIPAKITSAWDSAVSSMSTTFNEAWAKVKDIGGMVTNVVGEQLNDFNNYIKSNTGIDIKQQGTAWLDRTKSNFNGAVDYTKQAAASLVDKAMQGVDWAAKNSTVGKALSKAGKGGEIGSPERAMQLLMEKGWSKEDAAAIAANLNSESRFDTGAVGDGNTAIGIAQWHPDRQKVFEAKFNKKLQDASFDEQVSFIDWELRNTHKSAGNAIRLATGLDQKTAATEQRYEISALGKRGGVQPERIADARKYATIDFSGAPIARPPKAPSMPAIAEAPKVVEPLNSPVSPEFTVNIPSQDVGQRLSDRTTAYIASGGIHK